MAKAKRLNLWGRIFYRTLFFLLRGETQYSISNNDYSPNYLRNAKGFHFLMTFWRILYLILMQITIYCGGQITHYTGKTVILH